jgi:hypothetical protein
MKEGATNKPDAQSTKVLSFGQFRLVASERLLLKEVTLVPVVWPQAPLPSDFIPICRINGSGYQITQANHTRRPSHGRSSGIVAISEPKKESPCSDPSCVPKAGEFYHRSRVEVGRVARLYSAFRRSQRPLDLLVGKRRYQSFPDRTANRSNRPERLVAFPLGMKHIFKQVESATVENLD